VSRSISVRVPATSANLGPGFDCLGLALAITVDVTVALEPSPDDPHPLTYMALSAARAAYRAADRDEPLELRIGWQATEGSPGLPVARGLGASAAARVAGVIAANELMGSPLSADEVFIIAVVQEGHPDNVAPALFGGLQVTWHEGGSWGHLSAPIADGLKVVLFVPDFEMPTQESRRRLAQRVAREDAVLNTGRAALLVAALGGGRWDLLDAATQDRLHQPARGEIFPALFDIFSAAKEAGAHAAYLSGGGSTVAALATSDEERIARLMQQAAISRGYSGKTILTEPSAQGARLL
jgi:homoserine kinase